MAVHFKAGYHDIFNIYSGIGLNDVALERAAQGGAKLVRFNIGWEGIEPTSNSDAVWSTSDPTYYFNNYNYYALASKAQALRLKVLPVINGAPPWLGYDRLLCHPEWVGDGVPSHGIAYYPAPTAAGCGAFADFVVKVIQFFENCGIIDAVEVWNEPNLYDNIIYIPPASHFSSILATTISRVRTAFPSKTVVSGGLYMSYQNPSVWKNYLDAFCNQCYSYGLGIHPYDLREFPNENHNNYQAVADAVVARILGLYDSVEDYLLAVHGIYNQDLWVTESGGSSRNPLQEDGQKRILRKLFGHNEGFDLRSRCKAALVYRLYPFDNAGGEAPGTAFYGFSTLKTDWSSKQAHNQLAVEWS